MDNATYLFDQFSSILKSGKRDDCEMSDDKIDELCTNFQMVFLLWDGSFLLARKYNPTKEDWEEYQRYVDAAVKGHVNLGLSITPKVHLMHKHVRWQMENIPGGLGNKMEDWVEKSHQLGKRLRARFRTMRNLQKRAKARQRVEHRDSDPAVIHQILQVEMASKRKFNADREDKQTAAQSRESERMAKRAKALEDYSMIMEEQNEFTLMSGLLLSAAAKKAKKSTSRDGGN